MTEKFIGFDIGGTKIFMSVVEINFGQRKFEFLDSKAIKNPINAEKIKQIILDYCQEAQKKFETNKVAISSAKIVDMDNLTVSEAEKIYSKSKFEFDFLKENSFQTVIENDGESFALGTRYFENNEDKQGLLTLTLGTGIGGGFINAEGQILRGKNNSSLEVSYLNVFYDNKWIKWSNICSGSGIERIYLEKTGEKKTAAEIFIEAEKNPEILAIIKKSQEYLGMGIANLINIFNPEKIVFGGSLSAQKSFVEGAMEISRINIFNEKAFPEWSISDLKEKINVLGVCAIYYID